MKLTDDFLKKLRSAFNLNIYEAKIWAALLSKGVATAGELSEMGDVPRSRSYDVLESLEKRGFVIMKLGRPVKYLAVQPEEIIKRVKKGIEEKAEEDVNSIEKVQTTDVFSELNLLFKQGVEHVDPTSIAGSFKGRSNIYDHALTMLSNAEKEVIISTTDSGILRKLEVMKTTLRKLKQSGVKIKIAAPLKTEKAKQVAKEFGEIAKVKPLFFNARFILVDNKELLFMVSSDDVHESADIGIWVTTPFFSTALSEMFNATWNNDKN